MSTLLTTHVLASISAGTGLYWAYFHRYETHMLGTVYLTAFLAASAAELITLVNVHGLDFASAVGLTVQSALSFLVGVFGNMLVFRLFLNPLNKFPGPFLARISSLWLSTQLGKSDGHFVLQDLHKRYGKYVRVGSNDLSIIDPEATELIYGNKSRATKGAWYDNDYPHSSMHMSRDKNLHDRRRRVWAPAFSEKALREYEPSIHRCSDQLASQIAKCAGANEPLNISKWLSLYSFDVMGLLAFGREYGMLTRGEKPRELELLTEALAPLAFRLPPWCFRILTAIPGLAAGYFRFLRFCVDQLTWRVQRSEKVAATGDGTKDIASWLLEAYTDVPHPEKDAMLQADTRLIIIAGSDTTATALTFLIFHIAQSPQIADALRAELGSLCGDVLQDQDIRTAPLLNACINEVLRLHPPVPSGVNRLAPPEGMRVGSTYIPGNVTFFMPQYVMGRDPSIYAEPDRFLPERWTTSPQKILHDGGFAPFLRGPFGCIGKNLALMELRSVTAKLVSRFDMKLAEGETGHKLLRQSKDHFTMELGDCSVVFRERK